MLSMIDQVIAARRVSAPLIVIETPDPQATMAQIAEAFPAGLPIVRWDICAGPVAYNDPGKQAVAALMQGYEDMPGALNSPSEVLNAALKLPGEDRDQVTREVKRPGSIMFYLNAHFYVTSQQGSEAVRQGICNLRDTFKANRRTLIMLCPAIDLPDELKHDILVITEQLISKDQARDIIVKQYENARKVVPDMSVPDDGQMEILVNEIMGLAAFPAEQAVVMSLTREGLNAEMLKARKRKQINSTKGISEYEGIETFDQIGGCDNVKFFLRKLLQGKNPPLVLLFIDEIEKQLAGVGGDSSGTSMDQLGAFLTWTQETKASGNIFVGPPGAAKSAIAKAAGNEAGIRTIILDFGALKNQFVGSSEARIRQALEVVRAASQGRIHMIATCNGMAVLPPELKRRFKYPIVFFDLPTAEERAAIWSIYLKKYNMQEQANNLPDAHNWTGAEIEACCEMAWRLDIDLRQASEYVVPVAVSGRGQLDKLRAEAEGKYISASYPGVYRIPSASEQVAPAQGERLLEVV